MRSASNSLLVQLDQVPVGFGAQSDGFLQFQIRNYAKHDQQQGYYFPRSHELGPFVGAGRTTPAS